MSKEITIDDQINYVRRIMLDRMNLQAVVEGKDCERIMKRLEREVDILEAVIVTLKNQKPEKR